MNLIGHLACTGDAPPAVRVGALLPDLLSLYRRKARPRPLQEHWEREGAGLPGAAGVLAGMDFHHHVDRLFHRAPLFEECAAEVQAALRAASDSPGLKRFLPGHVLAELYMDHLLLADAPAWSEVFYGTLESQRRALLVPFVSAHPLVHGRTFSEFLGLLVDGRFLDDYQDMPGIFGRMDRILLRFGQRALEPAERQAVAEALAARASRMRVQLGEFTAAARQSFARPGLWLEPAA